MLCSNQSNSVDPVAQTNQRALFFKQGCMSAQRASVEVNQRSLQNKIFFNFFNFYLKYKFAYFKMRFVDKI